MPELLFSTLKIQRMKLFSKKLSGKISLGQNRIDILSGILLKMVKVGIRGSRKLEMRQEFTVLR